MFVGIMSDIINRFKVHLSNSKRVRSAKYHYNEECGFTKIKNCNIYVKGKTVTVTVLIRLCYCSEKSKYVEHSELVNTKTFTKDQLDNLMSNVAKHGIEIHLSPDCYYRNRFCNGWFVDYYTLEKMDYCPTEFPQYLL